MEDEIENVIYCKLCNRVFTTKGKLKQHMNRINKCIDKENRYTCKICKKKFKKKCHLDDHMARKKKCVEVNMEEIQENKINAIREKVRREITKEMKEKGGITITTNNIININAPMVIAYCEKNYPEAKNIEQVFDVDNIPESIKEQCEGIDVLSDIGMILDKTCNIDTDIRPIHCTDVNRLTFAVKSKDEWKTDPKGKLIQKNMRLCMHHIYDDRTDEILVDNKIKATEKLSRMVKMTYTDKICPTVLKNSVGTYYVRNDQNMIDDIL